MCPDVGTLTLAFAQCLAAVRPACSTISASEKVQRPEQFSARK
jgi:hypothetical protein